MSEQMIFVYDANGRGQYTVNAPWPDTLPALLDAEGQNYVIYDDMMVDKVWVDVATKTPHTRVNGPWTINTLTPTTAQDFVISGLPSGAKVRIGSETYTITDGTFEFESPSAASYMIVVEHWPYLNSYYEVVFS